MNWEGRPGGDSEATCQPVSNGASQQISAYDGLFDALRDHGCDVKETGQDKAISQCPAHPDRNPSLSITKTAGRTLVYCHAGCDTVEVLAAINRTMADLYDEPYHDRRYGDVYARYEYPGGRVVLRTADKQFPQPGNNKDRSLYHADRIGDEKIIYFVEGEEDVHAVEAHGGAAVCSAMGAGKAKHADLTPLAGKHIIVVADKDRPGRGHAALVAELLDGTAASVRIVEAAVGKDASNHLGAGKTLDQLVAVDDVPGRRLVVTRGSQVTLLPLEWWEPGLVLHAAINLLAGREGKGKSTIAASWAARETQAGGTVLWIGSEEPREQAIAPRLTAAGANMDRVIFVDVETNMTISALIFPLDLPAIERLSSTTASR